MYLRCGDKLRLRQNNIVATRVNYHGQVKHAV